MEIVYFVTHLFTVFTGGGVGLIFFKNRTDIISAITAHLSNIFVRSKQVSGRISFQQNEVGLCKYRVTTIIAGECQLVAGLPSECPATALYRPGLPNDIHTPPLSPHCLTVSLQAASVSAVKKAICEKLHSGPVPRPSTSVQTLFLTLKKASVSVLLKCPVLFLLQRLNYRFLFF